jgi:hypothetical protein
MDALHDGLEINPFSEAKAGLVLPLQPSVDFFFFFFNCDGNDIPQD